jgi:aminoglycoside phosphotransferase (APT) family kinase protein
LPNPLRQGKTEPVLGHSPWPVLRRPRMAGFEVTTEAQVQFLAELVKVPSDNPPGDCAPHATRAAELLEQNRRSRGLEEQRPIDNIPDGVLAGCRSRL